MGDALLPFRALTGDGVGMDRYPREREILMKRRKRFAIVIGVAAAGVIALGTQTAAAATYNTRDDLPGRGA